MRVFLLLIFLFSGTLVLAQSETLTPDYTSGNYNKKDAKGLRTGLWIIETPPLRGEPGTTDFGTYIKGAKNGPWYKMLGDGDLQSIENYKNNLRDGESKYFENNRLVAVGNYVALNPDVIIDTIVVIDPVTQDERLVAIESLKGSVRNGLWRYYDARTGRLNREERWIADELIVHKDFEVSQVDSVYYKQYREAMPHNTGERVRPPRGREFHY